MGTYKKKTKQNNIHKKNTDEQTRHMDSPHRIHSTCIARHASGLSRIVNLGNESLDRPFQTPKRITDKRTTNEIY